MIIQHSGGYEPAAVQQANRAIMTIPPAESRRLAQGQWLRYLVDTFWNKGEPVLQPGDGERFGTELRAERIGKIMGK